jgi:hypothetical protein
MVDGLQIVRTFLLANSALTDLIGTRLWAGETEPPHAASYQPADGAAVVFTRTGGTQSEQNDLLTERYQFKCYGATPYDADTTARVLDDALGYRGSNLILGAVRESAANLLREPDTNWPFALAFYRVQVRNADAE